VRALRAAEIRPLTEFRAHAAAFVEQIRLSRAPLFLTNRGRAVAVLLDVNSYDALVDEIDVLREIRAAELQVDAKRHETHEAVDQRVRAMFGR
jgi:prevent-host-death family protein